MDEELHTLWRLHAQGVLSGEDEFHPSVRGGKQDAPLWLDDHPRPQQPLGKGGVGALGDRGHLPAMGQPNTTEAWGNAALIGGLLSAKTKNSFTNGLETCDLFTKIF